MLKGISPLLSPELLHLLARMGHGDELVLVDANFPAEACARHLVRADGHPVVPVLEAILTLFPVDTFVAEPALVMQRVDEPGAEAPIWAEFRRALNAAEGREVPVGQVERFAFYERSKQAFGIVATGETALYGNLILSKGVIAP